MKAIHSLIAALGLAFVLPTPVDAGVNDPEVIIYRFNGVRDSGGTVNTGVATVFLCTNFSGVLETIRFVTRDSEGFLIQNSAIDIPHVATRSVVTHRVASYVTNLNLATGGFNPGSTAIAATSTNIICTAVTIDAANSPPTFALPLRGIRFNPAPGSQE